MQLGQQQLQMLDLASCARKKSCAKNLAGYTDNCGSQVRSGRRQSMPSSSIDNCARVSETVPLVACSQTKRPRSSRFANKHNPSPPYQRTLIRSPPRLRNTNTCPENGFCSSLVCTNALSPVKPRRKSVTPAAIQMHVFAGNAIMLAGTPATPAPAPDRRCLRCALVPGAVRCESYPVVVSRNPRSFALPADSANSRSPEPAATSSPAYGPQVFLPGRADASQTPDWR